jgi:CHAT domain-containing protein
MPTTYVAAYGVALMMAGRPRAGLAAIQEAAEGAVGTAKGRIQIRLAYALWLLGRYAEMLRASQRAVDLLGGKGDLVWEGRALGYRAKAALALGAVDRADEDYARSQELFAAAGQRLEYASALHDRATTAFARGDVPAALALLDSAQQVVDDLEVFEPDLFVTRVQVLLAAELHHDALRVADEGVARSVALRGSGARRAELLFAAALAASAGKDHATAADRSAEALKMFRRQQRAWWAVHAELVLLQSRYDGGDRSAALLRAATSVASFLELVDVASVPAAHLLAGRLALARGRTTVAVGHLRAASARRPRDVHARSTTWLARAVLAQTEGRHDAMLRACSRGLDLIDLHLGTLGATELRAQATALGSDLARLALRHAVRSKDTGRLLVWSERWRATALAVPPIRLDVEPEMTRDLAALRMLSQRLAEDDPSVATAALQREQRRLEDAVRRRAMHRRGAGSGETRPIRVADLRTELGDTELVELTDVDGELFAIAVSGDRPPVMLRVGQTATAERALAQALFALRREAIRRKALGKQPIGERLQRTLLGPVVDWLSATSVVVVPTGVLHAVPWALLPVLEDRAVTVSPSAAMWLRGRRAEPPDERRVVLVGGPRLSTGAAEVRRLAESYPQAVVLAEGDATSARVLAAMDGAWLVHIAAHGTFRSDSPLLSALELDDGPLTVYDLERLDRAPHRIVLSSCNSALGAPSGADELLGVVRALMSLGSAGVVASVVPVDDPATVPFMLALHQRLGHEGLGEALVGGPPFPARPLRGADRRRLVHRARWLSSGIVKPDRELTKALTCRHGAVTISRTSPVRPISGRRPAGWPWMPSC